VWEFALFHRVTTGVQGCHLLDISESSYAKSDLGLRSVSGLSPPSNIEALGHNTGPGSRGVVFGKLLKCKMGLESGAPPQKVMGALGHRIEGKGVVKWVWEITSYHQVAKTICCP